MPDFEPPVDSGFGTSGGGSLADVLLALQGSDPYTALSSGEPDIFPGDKLPSDPDNYPKTNYPGHGQGRGGGGSGIRVPL